MSTQLKGNSEVLRNASDGRFITFISLLNSPSSCWLRNDGTNLDQCSPVDTRNFPSPGYPSFCSWMWFQWPNGERRDTMFSLRDARNAFTGKMGSPWWRLSQRRIFVTVGSRRSSCKASFLSPIYCCVKRISRVYFIWMCFIDFVAWFTSLVIRVCLMFSAGTYIVISVLVLLLSIRKKYAFMTR